MPLKLMKGIRHFKNTFTQHRTLFDSLAQGQNPEILFITCSDSRIIPSLITHADPGDLFTIRNAGNIVPPYPVASGEAATIEYALKILDIKEIIVCGHSKCGAMGGLLTQKLDETPAVSSWLIHAQRSLENIQKKRSVMPENAAHKLTELIKENILVQIENLKTHPIVAERLQLKKLTIHGWFYELESGEIHIYDHNSQDFIPFEKQITQLFLSDLIQQKTEEIINQEAMDYLAQFVPPQTAAEYQQLMTLFNHLNLKGIAEIWESIKVPIREELWLEFGDLCENSNDSRFISLLERSVAVKLNRLKDFLPAIQESQGYLQYCTKIFSRFCMRPAPRHESASNLEAPSVKWSFS